MSGQTHTVLQLCPPTHTPLHPRTSQAAAAELLSRLPRLPPERLLQLLELSFPFVGISDLRAVPLAILDRLQPVPGERGGGGSCVGVGVCVRGRGVLAIRRLIALLPPPLTHTSTPTHQPLF